MHSIFSIKKSWNGSNESIEHVTTRRGKNRGNIISDKAHPPGSTRTANPSAFQAAIHEKERITLGQPYS